MRLDVFKKVSLPVLKAQKAKQFHKVPSFEFKTFEVHELLSPNSKIQSLCSLKCCFMTNNFTKTLLSCAAILNLPDNSRAVAG